MTLHIRRICALAVIGLATAACRSDNADRAGIAYTGTDAAPADTVVVYKTPTCGCCSDWVDHVAENGFAVVVHDLNDLTATKRELGVPAGRISCHTATVRGYTIEGHVPADLIHRLIAEKPRGVKGLAVPGMPMGSPGMEGLVRQNYDVLAFDDQGNVEVYAKR
ncbi:MAG: DUF411 domain-containing protein [Longimicrobiales bacterium]